MNELDKVTVLDSYLPDNLISKVVVKQAFVAKIGFVRLVFNSDFNKTFLERLEARNLPFNELLDEFYKVLSSSPHVMEISPAKDAILDNIALRLWPDGASLDEYIKMRVVMPKRKQEALFKVFSKSWAPEEFTLFFDGAIFLACAPISEIPLLTDIGQIAREFLRESYSESTVFEHLDGFGPTPIHPEIYFLFVEPKEDSQLTDKNINTIFTVKEKFFDDLVVVTSEKDTFDDVVRFFLNDTHTSITNFYEERITGEKLDETMVSLSELNQTLGELLAKYIEQNPISRLFSTISGEIRRTLGAMHLTLQKISALELEDQNQSQETIKFLEKTIFLDSLSIYFKEQMESDFKIDKNSQLTIMNFAAEETVNLAIIQATLMAAFIGAIIGGVITIIAQYLLK